MNYKTTEWFKCFDIDEEGKFLSPTEWKVTLKNGMVYKSTNWIFPRQLMNRCIDSMKNFYFL